MIWINFVLKTNALAYEMKDLNGEQIIGTIYGKELLLCKL